MELATKFKVPFFEGFHPNSKVWIYQADRKLTEEESQEIKALVTKFASAWAVHGSQAKARGELVFQQFIIFVVDESTPASGCSIDTSVHFVKQLESTFDIDFFNRMNVTFIHPHSEEISLLPVMEMRSKLKSGELSNDILVFNNSVSEIQDFQSNWIVPARKTWLI